MNRASVLSSYDEQVPASPDRGERKQKMTRVVVISVALCCMGAAPAPAPSPSSAPSIQFGPKLALPAATISQIELAAGGFAVTVDNPSATVSSLSLQYKGKTLAFETKSKAPVIVQVPDPDAAALCNIGKLAFQLTGPNADTRVRHAELAAPPTFNAGGGSLSGTAGIPGDTEGKVVIVAGGATHWYGCGQKFEVGVQIANKTTVNPQQLKLELLDVDGTKMAEGPANVKAQATESIGLATTGNVSGRLGQVRVRLTDASPELSGKLPSGRDLLVTISRASGGPLALKLVD